MVNRKPVRRKKLSNEFGINCKWVVSLIMYYINGELDRRTTQAFEEHLSLCPDCVAFLDTYKKPSNPPNLYGTRTFHRR
jgi:hypothetical protein